MLILFNCSVVSDPLQPNEPKHARFPCPSLSPRVCSHSCSFSWWCHPTISSSVTPLLLLPSIFPSSRVFLNESALRIRWPKYLWCLYIFELEFCLDICSWVRLLNHMAVTFLVFWETFLLFYTMAAPTTFPPVV